MLRLAFLVAAFALVLGAVADGGGLARSSSVLTVTRTDDPAGSGNCPADCSFRQAIAAAGANGTVSVPAGSYTLSQGQIDVTQTVTISGAGASVTTIEQTAGQRVFEIDGGESTISDLTITGGRESGSSGDAHAGVGGGFYVAGGATLVLNSSTLTGNTATVSGGGIDSNGTVVVDRSAISNNTAPGTSFGIGGAIDDFGTALTVTNSTVYDNVAGNQGGAILAASTAELTNDTIVANQAGTTGGGAGVYVYGSADVVVLNTILAQNTDTLGGSDNCNAALDSHGHNIDSDGSCALGAAGDQANTDPGFDDESPALNGGQTDSFALPATSPAVDAGYDGDNTDRVPSVDQRGVSRPQGAHVDVGAYEYAAVPQVSADRSSVTASPTSVPADGVSTSTITVTVRDGNGSPVAGTSIGLHADGSSTISQPSGTSSADGVVRFTVTDATAETVVYTARDETDGLAITESATVGFTAPVTTPTTTTTTTTTSAGGSSPPAPAAPVPSFTASPTAAVAGQSVSFDASATTGATSYAWDFGDGQTGTGASAGHVFAAAGHYAVTLTATGAGGSAHVAQIVDVAAARPPTAEFTFSVRGADVLFNAAASERGSFPIASYHWVFGDGKAGVGRHTSHDYAALRAYAVTLVVTDAAGATGHLTRKVELPTSVAVSISDGATEADSPASLPHVEISIHDGVAETDTVTVIRHPAPHHGK